MAGPHVAGLAALILSQGVAPRAVQAVMEDRRIRCRARQEPADLRQLPVVQRRRRRPVQEVQAHNSFYGAGEIDALAAVD